MSVPRAKGGDDQRAVMICGWDGNRWSVWRRACHASHLNSLRISIYLRERLPHAVVHLHVKLRTIQPRVRDRPTERYVHCGRRDWLHNTGLNYVTS